MRTGNAVSAMSSRQLELLDPAPDRQGNRQRGSWKMRAAEVERTTDLQGQAQTLDFSRRTGAGTGKVRFQKFGVGRAGHDQQMYRDVLRQAVGLLLMLHTLKQSASHLAGRRSWGSGLYRVSSQSFPTTVDRPTLRR